mmetsp:Transcript_18020/g.33836  ORF Transcript_18020/g.33836 Transcript_18020/m.33836 type:complete len:394 (+) Transcript_18020:93-1274(+)
MMEVSLPKDFGRLRVASAGLPAKQVREELHPCICDSCGGLVLGTRFKCAVCWNFDLCATCHRTGALPQRASQDWHHDGAHPQVVMPQVPLPQRLARALFLVEAFSGLLVEMTGEIAPDALGETTDVCCHCRGCPSKEGASSVAICSGCGAGCCPACYRCCLGAPAVQLHFGAPAKAKAFLSKARAVVGTLPWLGEEVTGVEQDVVDPVQQRSTQVFVSSPSQDRKSCCDIRVMTHADLNAVLSVESICFMEPYPRSTFEHLLHTGSSQLWVGLVDDAFAGYLILDTGRCRRHEATKPAYIVSLAVLPTCRGRGVAESLMRKAVEHARSLPASCVELHVHSRNEAAQRLYRRCGFEVAYEIEDYYGQSGDLQSGSAFVMSTNPAVSTSCGSSMQ